MLLVTYHTDIDTKYAMFDIKKGGDFNMPNEDMSSIFEQINNLKVPTKGTSIVALENESLHDVLKDLSEEIKRVMMENDFTQEDLCRITNMSQSNISKIQNCKVVPKIETLQKIAEATHTKLIISFESTGGED